MLKKMKRKIMALAMTAAMVTTLFAGMTSVASADTTTADVVITTQTELNSFLSSSETYAGQIVSYEPSSTLTASSVKSNFAGTFQGNGNTITLNISTSTDNTAFIGTLANTGKIKNISFSGSVSSTTSGDYVAAVVGYNAGIIDKVNNGASVTANSAFNIGGLAGLSTGKILNSSNSGTINGYRKIGGIVGENDGKINSCSNVGGVSSNYNRKNGVGGIAGLNGDKDTPTKTGHIWNCYNTGSINGGQSSWIGGICGLENALSDCVNCYNKGVISGYDYLDNISGKTEGSNYNCYGDSSVTAAEHFDSAIIIPTASITTMSSKEFLDALKFNACNYWTRANGLPYLTNVATGDEESPASGVTISMYSSPFQTTYNAGDVFSDAGMIIRATGADGSVAQVTDYTISKTTALATTDTSIVISGIYNGTSFSFTVAITVTNPSIVYLNTAASNNGDGSANSPYNTLSSALSAANAGDKIALMNTVALSSTATMHDNVSFVRASGFTGTMFEVNPGTGNLVRLTTMRIDGAANGTTTPTGTLINVTSGTLNLRGGIIMKNGVTGVNVGSNGTLEVNKALISGSTNSIVNAGNLTINDYGGTTIKGTISNSGSASMNGGTISDSTGTNGGGISQSAGTFTLADGKITGNTATNGGGVYIGGGTFTMNGGTITGNTATTAGSGVYVSAGATFEYAGSGIASGQVVYLANTSGNSDAYITLTGTSLSSLTVQCANPTVDTTTPSNSTLVAKANEEDLDSSFVYVNNSYGFTSELDESTWDYNIFLTTYGAS